MADKPTEYLDWINDDDAAKFAAPSAAKRLQGWISEKPPFQYFNWAWRLVDRWLQYCDEAIDTNAAAIGDNTAGLAAHAGLTAPHSATAGATADRLMLRDANGRAQVAAGVASGEVVNVGQVDDIIAGFGAGATGTLAMLALNNAGVAITPGSLYAGSGLRYNGIIYDYGTEVARLGFMTGGVVVGTWRALGYCEPPAGWYGCTLFLRTA